MWLFFKLLFYYFILFIFGCVGSQLWLCGSFIAACRIFHCSALASLQLWCEGSRARGLCSLSQAGSLVEAHRLSCPSACGILVPGPGIEPTSPHWEADSLPLDHQGSPQMLLFLIDTFHQIKQISFYSWFAQRFLLGAEFYKIPVSEKIFFSYILLMW